MRKLAIASIIALGASLSFGMMPASAASVHIGPNGVRITEHHHHHRHHSWRHHHRHCYTKTVRKWHHGHRVTKHVRVCR
ncbi:MAG: hypothetical protein ACTHJ3_18085 [Pararhizobium sp.]